MAPALSNKIRTNVYLDANLKTKAKEIFKQYGMGLSDAFNIFLSQSVMERGIPFEVKIPNKETQKAIKDARNSEKSEEISFEKHIIDMKKCITN
jgi:DNA-damage-inducible protein J